MPQSPYRQTVYPPIQDVDQYRRELILHRASWEDGARDKDLVDSLLDTGERLGEHCEFLETKLDIKKREYGQLVKQNDTLKKENEVLKKENEVLKGERQAQKMEIAALKSELEKAGTATGTEEQLSSNGDDTRVEANPQDAESEIREAEKLERSLESSRIANSRKRSAEIDAVMDGKAVKKGRTGKDIDMI